MDSARTPRASGDDTDAREDAHGAMDDRTQDSARNAQWRVNERYAMAPAKARMMAATLPGLAPDSDKPYRISATVLVTPVKQVEEGERARLAAERVAARQQASGANAWSEPASLRANRVGASTVVQPHVVTQQVRQQPVPQAEPAHVPAVPAVPAAVPEPEPSHVRVQVRTLGDTGSQKRHAAKGGHAGRKKATVLGLAVAALAIGFGVYAYVSGREDTDDAQVDAHMTVVSARLVGTVKAVYVQTNQVVKEGELIAELDPADFHIAVASARAELERAEAALLGEEPSVAMTITGNESAIKSAQAEVNAAAASFATAQRDVQQLRAQLDKAEAQATLASVDRQRTVLLESGGALSRSARDNSEAAAHAATADATAVRAGIAAAEARLRERDARIASARASLAELRDNSPRQIETRRAAYAAARAARDLARSRLDRAEADLMYTKIFAPVAGIIGGRPASVGDPIAPGQQLFSLCRTDELWITANFRETQLKHMRPGQTAKVYVDALDREFLGTVESMAGATGARFSLLPPENASGNYVKVVQRIPVRIGLVPNQSGLELLRAGMSVVPTIQVR